MESFWEWLSKIEVKKLPGVPFCPATDKHGKCQTFEPNLRLLDRMRAEVEESLRQHKRRARDLEAVTRHRM